MPLFTVELGGKADSVTCRKWHIRLLLTGILQVCYDFIIPTDSDIVIGSHECLRWDTLELNQAACAYKTQPYNL